MNKIVLEHFPASKLPAELRADLPADAVVRVTVEEETVNAYSPEQLRRQLEEVRRSTPATVTAEQAVERIRRLRDEWGE